MPVDTEHDTQYLLQTMLAKLAAEENPHETVYIAIKSLADAYSADGVSLVSVDGLADFFVFNDVIASVDDGDVLRTWAASLPDDFTEKPILPSGILSIDIEYWITVKLPDQSLVCMWYGQQPENIDTAQLVTYLNVVALTLQHWRMYQKQERAYLLANSMIGGIADPLLMLAEDRTVMMMNPAAEDLFQIRAKDAAGLLLDDVVRDHALIKIIENQPRQADITRPAEWSVDESDKLIYLPLMSVIYTPMGIPDGWVLSLRDISRFKRLNRNQREFMRVVSHDLRSPLTSMQGFADMIRMGMVGDLTEKQAYFIDKILAGVTQMTSIVDNIQDAGRFDPETGFYEMERVQLDLGEIASKIVQNQIVPAEKQALSFALRIDDNVPIIYADENMITRAVANLVDNAIKYTPDGGEVVVEVTRESDNVLISVADDGYGISEENQKRLFQRHVRIARREHVRIKGTGLGLFIVRAVAQAHGGDARVRSVLGEGAVFSIVIPLNGANINVTE